LGEIIHTESPLPRPAKPGSQLAQLQDARAAAVNHRKLIPGHNDLARGISDKIIREYDRQITALTAEDWMK
jgi:hypothetical protein